MRREVTLALCLASLSGMFAAVGAYDWLVSMADSAKNRSSAMQEPALALTPVVVAKEDLTFGAVLTQEKLRVADWPADSVPAGSFRSVEELFAEQDTRTVLENIQNKEPVLKGRITGPGQRASLSTMLRNGMRAVSVKVDEVVGVAGFVLPGDYVDVLVTYGRRNVEERRDGGPEPSTDLLLQRLRVLAIDQSADPRQDSAKVARTVTLEASQIDAQKITLASNIADLSLVLRENAATAGQAAQKRVNVSDLNGDIGDKNREAAFVPTIAVAPAPSPAPTEPVSSPRANIKIWRGDGKTVEDKDYAVGRVLGVD